MLFGNGGGGRLETIALIYDLSRERVRQIETVALRKLQRKLQLALPEYTEEYGKSRNRRVADEREEGEEDEEDRDS
jgi:Sigma-70, region 4